MAAVRWLLLVLLCMFSVAAAVHGADDHGKEAGEETPGKDCGDEEAEDGEDCPDKDDGDEEVRTAGDDVDAKKDDGDGETDGDGDGDGDTDGDDEEDGEGEKEEGEGRSLFRDPCSSNPCPVGSSCIRTGFDGYECTPNADPCDPNPCGAGSRCSRSGPNGYTCVPIVPPDPCRRNPCPALHRCDRIGLGGGYQCVPPPPTPTTTPPTTTNSFDPSVCRPNPCENGCQCKESCRHASGYYCESENGYLGKNCTIPRPVVECEENQIIVIVDDAFVREYDLGIKNAKLFMSVHPDNPGQQCFSRLSGSTHAFTIPLPFNGCGTKVEKTGMQTKVTNNIWLNRITGAAFDMPVPVICFECLYTKEYSFMTSLKPTFNYPPPLKSNGVKYVQGTIELCKVGHTCPATACPAPYRVTGGAVYTVGELVHVIIKGDQDASLVAVRNFFLSCDGQSRSALPVVNLVKNGCPASTGNRMPAYVTHTASSAVACVSFQVPRLHDCSTFFIHAQMEICPPTGCVTSCPGSTGRRKRSAGKPDIEDVFGPIYVITGSKGIPNEILFPDESLVNVTAKIADIPSNRLLMPTSTALPEISELGPPVYLIVLTVVVVCLLLIVASFVFVLRGSSGKFTSL